VTTLEDDIRALLHSQANAMQVPEPHLSRSISLTPVVPQPSPDTDHLDSDELVPIKEINVSLHAPTSKTSSRRTLLMAAAAVVAVIGVTGIALAIYNRSADDDQTETPAAATTVAPKTTVALTVAPAMKSVHFDVTLADIPVTFTVPDNWTLDEGNAAFKGTGVGAVGLHFDEIPNIYADGCQWVPLDPPVGPTVDDLVTAWTNLPDFAATAAVDVAVDGFTGKQIEFTVPDYDIGECRGADSPVFGLWTAPDHAFPAFEASGPYQHTQQRILDVAGNRLVITAYYDPNATPQDRADLEQALASIHIG
jgi:hypothetical protein